MYGSENTLSLCFTSHFSGFSSILEGRIYHLVAGHKVIDGVCLSNGDKYLLLMQVSLSHNSKCVDIGNSFKGDCTTLAE